MALQQKENTQEKKLKTHTIFVIDNSGSMISIEQQANKVLSDQMKLAQEQADAVSIISVSSRADVVAEAVRPKSGFVIRPSGGTALLDGLYMATFIANRYLTYYDRTLVVVISDGEENESKFATWNLVNQNIGDLNRSDKFTIAFYGTIESMNQVHRELSNIRPNNTAVWNNTPVGTVAMGANLTASAAGYYGSQNKSVSDFASKT